MSAANVKTLFARAQTEPAVRQKIEALPRETFLAGLVDLASEYDLPCTQAELAAFLSTSDELTEEELSRVIGGLRTIPYPLPWTASDSAGQPVGSSLQTSAPGWSR